MAARSAPLTVLSIFSRMPSVTRFEIPTRVSSQAQKTPTSRPKVAVEKPRKLKPFTRVSTQMKKPPTTSPPIKPAVTEISTGVFFVLRAMATPAPSQTSR